MKIVADSAFDSSMAHLGATLDGLSPRPLSNEGRSTRDTSGCGVGGPRQEWEAREQEQFAGEKLTEEQFGGKGEQPSGSKVAENAAGEVAARKAVEEAENGKGKGSSNELGSAGKNKIYELKGEEEIRAAIKASVRKAEYVIDGGSWYRV